MVVSCCWTIIWRPKCLASATVSVMGKKFYGFNRGGSCKLFCKSTNYMCSKDLCKLDSTESGSTPCETLEQVFPHRIASSKTAEATQFPDTHVLPIGYLLPSPTMIFFLGIRIIFAITFNRSPSVNNS